MIWWLEEAAVRSKLVRAEQEDGRRSQLERTVQEADAKRFPLSAAVESWCILSAWKLEEVTALSMGIDPHIISREIIKGLDLLLHPDAMNTDQDAPRLSPRARMYEDRLRHLERACEVGDVQNVRQAGDTWEVRPIEFLAWFQGYVDRYGERYPWNEMHPFFLEQIKKDHPAPSNTEKKRPCALPYADSADSADSRTTNPCPAALSDGAGTVSTPADRSAEKGKADTSKGKKGPDACRAYLRSEMRKEERTRNNQDEDVEYCMKRFGIKSERAVIKIWKEIAKETDCPWAKRGRPPKAT